MLQITVTTHPLRKMDQTVLLLCVLSIVSQIGNADHLPSLTPTTYCKSDNTAESWKTLLQSNIYVRVNRLDSDESAIPYEYQHFDFCTTEGARIPTKNLGQDILGDRIQLSSYNFRFLQEEECSVACIKNYTGGIEDDEKKLQVLRNGISLDYNHHWSIDDIPVTLCYLVQGDYKYCSMKFPMGCYIKEAWNYQRGCFTSPNFYANLYGKPKTHYIFNHLDFVVTYNGEPEEDWNHESEGHCGRIISIEAIPTSISHNFIDGKPDCSNRRRYLEIPSEPLSSGRTLTIAYTYSVHFQRNDTIKWSSRWDHISNPSPSTNIQWYSILNSLIIIVLLSGMVARIMFKTSREAVSHHNQTKSEKDEQKESGWKLIENDVFRPPRNGMLLSVFLGSGVQVLFMSLVTLAFACFGYHYPGNRGPLMSCAIISYICFGTLAGYVSARMYKSFGGERWISNVLLTSMLSSGLLFSLFFAVNRVFQIEGSSAAVPSNTIIILLTLWFGIAVPLTFVGAYFGIQNGANIKNYVLINETPREIPAQRFITQAIPGAILGGILPFGCIFVQLFFILSSVWSDLVYNMFGSLFIVFLILAITCSECTVILCYFHLRNEDYRWWWRSFLTSGSTAFYLLIYCVHYFETKLIFEDATSAFIYFAYTAMMFYLFFLLTGSIGFFTCYWFVREIYAVSTVTGSKEDTTRKADTEFEKFNKLEFKEEPKSCKI